MQINWNTKIGIIEFKFTYPYVDLKQISKNKFNASDIIVGRAIAKHLKGTKIRWSAAAIAHKDTSLGQFLTLKIDTRYTEKKLSVAKLNKILHNINLEIHQNIHKLINQ